MKETKIQRAGRAQEIIKRLRKHYPGSQTALKFGNPLQLLVATILSAQCTDAQVNKVTPALFRKYPTAEAFAAADLQELARDIHSTGFFNNKSRSIFRATQSIVSKFNGRVPHTMEELLTLDGVGRKTANCVLGNAYGIPAVTVDTHVKRLTFRMGLTRETDPDKIEFDIKAMLPEADWLPGSHMIIDHGRKICTAKKPNCSICFLSDLCPKIGIEPLPVSALEKANQHPTGKVKKI
jgi:endonuclease III